MIETIFSQYGAIGGVALITMYATRYLFAEFKKMVEKNEANHEIHYQALRHDFMELRKNFEEYKTKDREIMLKTIDKNSEVMDKVFDKLNKS
jgi:poly(A) polymerase Pap1